MQAIPDNTHISTLSIPGTHNSAAFFKLSAPSVRCQGQSILNQLKNGVRFLDVRLSKDYMTRGELVNDLMVVHGKFPVKLSGSYKFKNILNEVYTFLELNPSETVLISIKLENTMLNWNPKTDEFAKVLFQKYIAHNRNRWYLNDQIPTLRYARGKAILLRRFPVIPSGTYKKFGIPAVWNLENHIYNDDSVCVQDFSDIKSVDDLNKKADLIKGMIDKAKDYHRPNVSLSSSNSSINSFDSANDTYPDNDQFSVTSASSTNSYYFKTTRHVSISTTPNQLIQQLQPQSQPSIVSQSPPKLFINFCSGANYFHKHLWPSKVDKAIRKFNIDNHYTKNCGILVLDFADRDDWKLVRKLVHVNY